MARKKTSNDTFSPELIEVLKQYPAVETVWINDAGEWSFHDRAGFVAFSVKEILSLYDSKPE